MPKTRGSAAGAKVLLHGLDLLRLLAQSGGPVSATALAEITGQHPSTVSRLLSALVHAGYVRKPTYHSYSADLGLIALHGRARDHFPVITVPRAVLVEHSRRLPGMRLSLATLHEQQLVYWLAVESGQEPLGLWIGNYGLHLSSIALRILLDRPATEALTTLASSRRWHGWERPTAAVPIDETGVLSAARRLLRDDCVVLDGWQGVGRISIALPVPSTDGRPLILALSGPTPAHLDQTLRQLHDSRDAVTHALLGALP